MKSYIVKLSKRNVQPADWRRVIMPAGATFNRLCETIGTAMQQESRNMDETGRFFEVEVDGMCITDNPARRDELKSSKTLSPKQPTRVKIDKPLEQHGELTVAYDSSKDGDIQVKLEKTVEDYHFGFPTLLDGEGPAYDKDHINMLLKFVKYKKTDWDQIQHQNYQIIEDPYRDSELAQDQAVREPVKTESKKPVEVKPLTAKQHEQVAYILTAARLYGMMSAEQIVMLYNEQNASSMTAAQLEELVQLNEVQEIFKKENLYYRDGTILGPKLIGIDPEQFVSETINKPYYMPSKEEVLRYADSSYFDRTPEVVKLEKLFQKENIPQIQINRMLHTFMEGLSAWHANFNAVVGRLMAQAGPLDEDSVRDIVPVAINVANSVRLIENRGYTPQEMFAIERQTPRPLTAQPSAVKVGRNDPCPCGSGKKYKKCCGR